MRKLLWVVGFFLLPTLLGILAPGAKADAVVDVSFTCSSSCAAVPTDPAVFFPSPTIPINFFSQQFNVTLNSLDKSSDQYSWQIDWTASSWYFVINDLTDGFGNAGPSFGFGQFGKPFGNGDVDFNCVATPEPSSAALLLVGLGVAFLAWKFKDRNGRVAAHPAA